MVTMVLLFIPENHMQPLGNITGATVGHVDLERYDLPAELDVKPTKENAKDMYIAIRQFLQTRIC